MKNKFSIAMSLAVILAMLVTSLALADTFTNDVTAGGNDTITAGGSTTITYKVNATGGDGQGGCNVTDGTPATVTITVPAGVSASTSTLTFTQCGVTGQKTVTYSSNTAGDYAITTSISDVGPGTYINNADFTLHVNAPPPPPNTAPNLNLPADMTVEGNTTGGANITYTASASDNEDGALTPTCVPASGSFFPLGLTTVYCSVTDAGGLSDSGSFNVTVVDTTAPSISCSANITGTVGQVVNLGSATASDIVDASPTVTNNAPSSFGPGTTTVTWTATDDSLNSGSCSQTVTLTYVWLGFFQPVDNLPTLNKAKAGQAIPFKWSLQDANGNYVSDLSTAVSYGYQVGSCTSATTDVIESYDTTGTSGLRYDSLANQFIFTSQTQKGWAGTCKTFILKLSDGTTHQANFNFVK